MFENARKIYEQYRFGDERDVGERAERNRFERYLERSVRRLGWVGILDANPLLSRV